MEISFSHISTFISLIFGFAIIHAITCISTYIQNINKMKFDIIWTMWSLVIMLFSTAIWWRIFRRWSIIEIWYPYYFIYLVLLSLLVALIFFIRFDKFDELDEGNLEKQFYKTKKPFFIMLSILFACIALGKDIVLGTINLNTIQNSFPLLIQGLIVLLLAFINHRMIHLFVAIIFFVLPLFGMFKH